MEVKSTFFKEETVLVLSRFLFSKWAPYFHASGHPAEMHQVLPCFYVLSLFVSSKAYTFSTSAVMLLLLLLCPLASTHLEINAALVSPPGASFVNRA